MLAKVQQDAIVIEDNQMQPEEIAVNMQAHNFAGNSSFDVQLAICKEDNLDDDPDTVINRRLAKFFEYGKKIQPGRQYFCPRKQPDYSGDAKPVGNELIIFGCDFKKLKTVKKEFETTQAIRINPSNFKLIYEDHAKAWKAIQKNIKDPSSLVHKMESQDIPLPTCWFEMLPYTVNNLIVKIYARFATEKELNLHPKTEEIMEMYRQCSEIYNQQERRLKQEEINQEMARREKLEARKQGNSDRLYNRYDRNTNKEWVKGKNSNPGANKEQREHSRSRSRSKDKKNKDDHRMEGEVNDNSSNYSFIFSKSKKDLNELNEAMGDIELKSKSEKEQILADVSLEFRPDNAESEYNWNGNKNEVQSGYKWSYATYLREQEEAEESARMGKHSQAVVITIDQ